MPTGQSALSRRLLGNDRLLGSEPGSAEPERRPATCLRLGPIALSAALALRSCPCQASSPPAGDLPQALAHLLQGPKQGRALAVVQAEQHPSLDVSDQSPATPPGNFPSGSECQFQNPAVLGVRHPADQLRLQEPGDGGTHRLGAHLQPPGEFRARKPRFRVEQRQHRELGGGQSGRLQRPIDGTAIRRLRAP